MHHDVNYIFIQVTKKYFPHANFHSFMPNRVNVTNTGDLNGDVSVLLFIQPPNPGQSNLIPILNANPSFNPFRIPKPNPDSITNPDPIITVHAPTLSLALALTLTLAPALSLVITLVSTSTFKSLTFLLFYWKRNPLQYLYIFSASILTPTISLTPTPLIPTLNPIINPSFSCTQMEIHCSTLRIFNESILIQGNGRWSYFSLMLFDSRFSTSMVCSPL